MAYAVTHILLVIIILDLLRHYVFKKEKFPRYLLVVGGIAGLVPDIDIIISWVYNLFTGASVSFHGTFTHSLIWPLLFLAIAGILHYQDKMKWAKIFYVISFGLFFHLFLDCTFGGYKTFFWPYLTGNLCPQWGLQSQAQSIDAIILVLWLVHEEVHKKIRDYI